MSTRHKSSTRYRSKPRRAGLGRLALAVLCLQALTPVGYMPAAADSGWLFQLCPDGLAPSTMALLHAGHGSHQGQDGHAGHSEHSAQPASDRTTSAWPMDCPFAAFSTTDWMLSAQASLVLHTDLCGRHRQDGDFVFVPVLRPFSFRARAPPASEIS